MLAREFDLITEFFRDEVNSRLERIFDEELNEISAETKRYGVDTADAFLHDLYGYAKEFVIPTGKMGNLQPGVLAPTIPKRFRPTFGILAYLAVGGKDENSIINAMAPIDLIHYGTLGHDDMRCMDGDEYRHCIKSYWNYVEGLHGQGEAHAANVGDWLYHTAYKHMLNDSDFKKTDVLALNNAMLEVASGVAGVAQGQDLDMWISGKPVTEDMVIYMTKLKTVNLYHASMAAGAVLGEATVPQYLAIVDYAHKSGMGFQFKDNVISLIENAEQSGKRKGNDLMERKSTLYMLKFMELTKNNPTERGKLEVVMSKGKESSDDEVDAVVNAIVSSGALEYEQAKAIEYAAQAKQSLNTANPSLCTEYVPQSDALRHALSENFGRESFNPKEVLIHFADYVAAQRAF